MSFPQNAGQCPIYYNHLEFKINVDMLRFWNENLDYVVEEGDFKVYVGGRFK